MQNNSPQSYAASLVECSKSALYPRPMEKVRFRDS